MGRPVIDNGSLEIRLAFRDASDKPRSVVAFVSCSGLSPRSCIYVTFLLLPQKKSNQKKRGHSNMLPHALAGAPPHLSEATAHAVNKTYLLK
jgi:hypothetical protein